MEEAIRKLQELLSRVESIRGFDSETLIDIKNKLNLYIQKFFKGSPEYLSILKKIDPNPDSTSLFSISLAEFKSLITTLMQDIELSQNEFQSNSESERESFNKIKREIKFEQERIQEDANEIRAMREELMIQRERLMVEEAKFDEFKAKLEIADKKLDFQSQAENNKNKAILWAVASGMLIAALLIILCFSLDSKDGFSSIAEYIKGKMVISKALLDNNFIDNTIYFTYAKYMFTKLMLYTLLLYSIVFCVKNYNAQMHNHVINTHKSNAFRSTLSLLNTAKSEDGNDKLLIQATQAIFSHQQTGYSGKESEQLSPNLVTNVIESASKKI
ncbi:MAG: hypothetical protein K0S53_788 [Bacteroidetes bacterium]|jgi:hypothetical protein|nr:hypothetical protein [Bacteroidota bacterium]